MKIRNAMGLDPIKLKAIRVDGYAIREITYHPGNAKPYRVQTGSGLILECRGHDRTEDLDSMAQALKPPGSDYRIRQYGEFGSTIN